MSGPKEVLDEGHHREKAGHDAGLRRGDRQAHPGHGHSGGALPGRGCPHPGHRRLRRSAARLRRRGGGPIDQAAPRPSEKARRRSTQEARRDPWTARARPRRDRHRRGVRAGREGQGLRGLDREGLPGNDQAPPVPPRPGHARLPQRPQAGLHRSFGDAFAGLQGNEDGRPDGREAGDPGRSRGGRSGSGAESPAREGGRSGPQERARGGSRGQTLMAAPKAPFLDAAGKKSKDVTLTADVFAAEVKFQLIHETVRAEAAAARSGSQSAKSRGLVSGGRAKPWRQKGTGRARAGTTRAPQWTGGGLAFPPTPRSFAVKVNRKARKSALRAALSTHAGAGSFALIEGSAFPEPSTKAAATLVAGWGKELPLVVVAQP